MNLNATIIGQTISFFLFLWFCVKYVWTPLMSIIESRQKNISSSLEEIKKSKIESDRMKEEALIFLKEARLKSEEIIKNAHKYKIQILNSAQLEASKERSRIISQAKIQINQERKQVVDELRKKIGQLIITSTEKIIDKSINEIIDHNFINNIIETLPYED